MTRDEWTQLVGALADAWQHGGTQPAGSGTPVLRTSSSVESVAQDAAAMQASTQTRMSANERPTASSSGHSAEGSDGSSVATDVLKTIGMVTGVGPVVTGLLKLFGGGSDDSAADPAPVRYELPSAVHVDAGLMPDRGIAGVSYGQNDAVRPVAVSGSVAGADENGSSPESSATSPGVTAQSAPAASGPTIQIQVNAMDSRSFMDHSDEIAQAVRNALLRSHSLNDVISEI